MGNDSDPDDPDGSELRAVLASDVDRRELSLNSDGSFTYTPEPDASYETSFTYRARDEPDPDETCSEPATVTSSTNDPREANNADTATTRVVEPRCTINARVGQTTRATNGDDVTRGTNTNDVIYARGGNDIIRGGEGEDKLHGEEGSDTIRGEGGTR